MVLGFSEAKYGVFMNFRGADTREVADYLYGRLREARIEVFMDDPSLPFGEVVDRELLVAIERSKIAIVIISQDYASSAWCLKELRHILKCNKERGLKVIPIFYKVNPSDVRNLTNSFERIRRHTIGYNGTIVESWKRALKCVGRMKGLVINGRSYEGRTVDRIIEVVKRELKNLQERNFNRKPEKKMYMDHLVGIDEHAREIIEAISEDTSNVQIVGIQGMGGVGKTTLAKYIYNQLLNSFEFCSFVPNKSRETLSGEISEHQLLLDILEQGSTIINSTNQGMSGIQQCLYNKKVFIVLDDFDSEIEMRLLMRMHRFFGPGSKIMLTTRNKGVFRTPEAMDLLVYELCGLDPDQSMQLFCHHAFGRHHPQDQFVQLTREVVSMTGGLPLVLEVIGSSLFGKKREEWESTLEALGACSSLGVEKALLIGYQALDDNGKKLFLDLASVPNGRDKCSLFPALEAADKEALCKLEALSLVKFDNDDKLCMHDLLRNLGREILQNKSIKSCIGLRSDKSVHNLKGSEEVFIPTPLIEEVAPTPMQLDDQGYFPEGCTPWTKRIQTRANTKGKEAKPWMSQSEFGESSKESKLRRVTSEVTPQFSRTRDTSMTGCNNMEAGTSLSQPIARLDRLFGEINSFLAHVEEKPPYSTQEAISMVDSFFKQINLRDAADVDFTSPSFLQSLVSLRQPNALHKIPRELQMAFHGALTSFAETPEYLEQIQSAKITFSKCIRDQMAKEYDIQKLKFKLDMDKNALQKAERDIVLLEAKLNALQMTPRDIVLLEAKLTSLKAKARGMETDLTNAIPTVCAWSGWLKRRKDQLVEAQARFDNIPTLEERVKTNHSRVLQILHEIKKFLRGKTRY